MNTWEKILFSIMLSTIFLCFTTCIALILSSANTAELGNAFQTTEGDICGPEPAGSAQSHSVVQLPRGQFDALMLSTGFSYFHKEDYFNTAQQPSPEVSLKLSQILEFQTASFCSMEC